MGYLNKETVTVDAILTKRGRELLARGTEAFKVTQFAVSDDEIDYGLYDLAHPLGSEFYGSAIENMPVVEASPDETQNLRYKLVTLSRALVEQINVIPTISLGGVQTLILTQGIESSLLIPQTVAGQQQTFDGPNFGYTAVLNDNSIATILVVDPVTNRPVDSSASTGLPRTETKIGKTFKIRAKNVSQVSQAVITFYGNQSGAEFILPITVNPPTV